MGGFYKGLQANIPRGATMNGTMLSTYTQSKRFSKNIGIRDGVPLQASASLISGFCMACTVCPLDVVRTRLMNQPTDGPKLYSGLADCARNIMVNEGPQAFYKGFVPLFSRFAPNTCL